jgi:hypothetical protein
MTYETASEPFEGDRDAGKLRSNFPASRSPKEIFAAICGVQNVHKAENQRYIPRTHVKIK